MSGSLQPPAHAPARARARHMADAVHGHRLRSWVHSTHEGWAKATCAECGMEAYACDATGEVRGQAIHSRCESDDD